MSTFKLLRRTAIGGLWLAAAFACQKNPIARQVMSYLGGVVAMVHVGAVLGATLQDAFMQKGRDGMDMPMMGLLGGVVVGALLGAGAGRLAVMNLWIYWTVQLLAAAFLAIRPLVRI